MSRAFVKEPDGTEPEELVDIPVPDDRNLVTSRGLAMIEAEISRLGNILAEAQAENDRIRIEAAKRDLRYWSARRYSAELVPEQQQFDRVRFGHTVMLENDSGLAREWTIVGQDEADAAKGLISYTSPVARALMGKAVGDTVKIGEELWEVTGIVK